MDEFETLLTSSRIAVDRWLKAHMGNCADAEDVLQETCLAAFQGFSRLQNKASFLPWILGIARRKCADWYRAQAKSKSVLMDHPPDQAECAPDDSAVNETLDMLPERDRLMLQLFYREMLSQRQIAEQLHIPEGTVKSRMSTAKAHFRTVYPYPPAGGMKMKLLSLPEFLPDYTIIWKDEAPFSVECEELTGWFAIPRPGERLFWGIYDLPSRKLDVAYDMSAVGPASVHGLEGVAIRAKVLPPKNIIDKNDPMKDAVAASTGGQEEWMFIAQEKDGYTRFLSAEHIEQGSRTLTTFLDGEAFMNNWGFGENNCGTPVHRERRGIITRSGPVITAAANTSCMDVAGRCDLILDGKIHDTICIMDLGMYEEGMVSEQYLDHDGRTVLWRRFNQDDWAVDRYGKKWSELLPENEQITINGQTYIHWYDCICLR